MIPDSSHTSSRDDFRYQNLLNRKTKYQTNMEKKFAGFLCAFLFTVAIAGAQPRTLTLDSAVEMGVRNSKQLKRSQNKIEESLVRLDQVKDDALPSAKVSFQYLHALMLSRMIAIPGVTKEPIKIPFDFPAWMGTLSVTEPIFAG